MENLILKWFLQSLARGLERKASSEQIRQYLKHKEFRKPVPSAALPQDQVRVAVVQEKIAVLKTCQAYMDRMHGFVQQAVDQGAELVCFPEENGLLLLGQIPLIDPLLRFTTRPHPTRPQPAQRESKTFSTLADVGISTPAPAGSSAGWSVPYLLSFFTPFLKAAFETTFSELARGFGVYIMAGSIMLVENKQLYNRAYLFDPQGRLVGTQDKAHPVETETAIHMSCAEELRVFDTTLGRLAFPVCMDATYFETFKILKQLGAQIVILPIANLEPYEPYLALRGIWPRVQESGVYGLKSALVGRLHGLEFTGKAGIFAPLDLTGDHSGVIAEAKTYDQDDVVTACLDLAHLERYTSDYFSDSNPALYQNYFPEIYKPDPKKLFK
jgi:predicted amidohydrolase